ncbi:hypothetical protein [Alienimonas sp. DA493]|uniref:hypothetical protein n=1 Tax=Alienimonas sp. DA493 TaxID=3373605 RepID=UPI0037548CCF
MVPLSAGVRKPAARRPPAGPGESLTASGLLLRFKEWAERYYVDEDGKPTRTLDNLRLSLRLWRERYGPTPVADFGPVRLAELWEEMIAAGLARTTINSRVGAVKRAGKWAVSRELGGVDKAITARRRRPRTSTCRGTLRSAFRSGWRLCETA